MSKDLPEDEAHRQAYLRYYELEHPDEYHDESYAWHPLHPAWTAVRHERERHLLRILRAFPVPLGEVDVLEVGSGNGVNLRFLVEMGFDPHRATGVELNAPRLSRSRRVNPGINVVRGDATRLPFPPNRFDLVTQFVAFSSMGRAERRRAASEVRRVLRPGGRLLWYDVRSPRKDRVPDGIDAQELRTLFPDVRWGRPCFLHSPLLTRFASHPGVTDVLTRFPVMKRTNMLLMGELAA